MEYTEILFIEEYHKKWDARFTTNIPINAKYVCKIMKVSQTIILLVLRSCIL